MTPFAHSARLLFSSALLVAATATGGCHKYDELGVPHVRTQQADLSFCANLAKERTPALAGQQLQMTLRFEIAPDGGVHRFGFHEDSVKDAGLRDCLTEKVKAWKFPPPPSGKIEQFDYPFNARF
jgi:hypothetical protein